MHMPLRDVSGQRLIAALFFSCVVCLSLATDASEIPDDWLERADGFEEGQAIQERARADMVLFIASRSPAGPARRSRQFEYDILRDSDMEAFLSHYVKVKLRIPTTRETNQLAEERFHVQYGPRLFVVRRGGFTIPISIHHREGDKRTLLPVEEIQQSILRASTPSTRPAAHLIENDDE